MGLNSGTPIWLSLLIAFGAVFLTHFLTRSRERDKREKDQIAAWRAEMLKLLQDVVDDANDYYFNVVNLPNTGYAAQRLNGKLRRLSNQMREMHCTRPADLQVSAAIVPELRDIITGPPDFQDSARAVRPLGDPIGAKIADCEARLRANISAPRKLPA